MNECKAIAKPATPWAILACGCLLWTVSQSVQADINLTIRGEILTPPPCVINGGSTTDVPFGDNLMTTRIDGMNYRRGVPYTIVCTAPSSNLMTLEFQGFGASFDNEVLQTGNRDLGVKLFVNGVDWPLNSAVNFSNPNFPVVEAVPVKRAGSTLAAGAFSAAGTLVVDYQ